MNQEKLRELLQALKDGKKDVEAVLKSLSSWPYEDLGFARVDHHRSLRRGFPEVIFGEGKSVDQIIEIMKAMLAQKTDVLVTRIDEGKAKAVHKTMYIDYFGTLYTTKTAVPMMIERKSGHIVNFSSGAGFLGVFGYSAYSAAKFAVRGFSDVLRSELKPYGVHVHVVFPPDTDTPQLHEENKIKPPETREIVGKQVKLLQPEDVAREVIRGIERHKYIIIPGFESKLYFLLTNGIIAFSRWYFDRIIASSRKKRGLPPAY